MFAIVSASGRVVSAIVVAAFVACSVPAVGVDVENGVEEKVEKVDGDVFGGTFIGASLSGSWRSEILEYRAIHNSISCGVPITAATAGGMAAVTRGDLNRYLSSVTGDAGAPYLTGINYDGAGNITGYTAYGQLSGNINKSACLAPGASIALLHNWRICANKIIGVDVRCEFSLGHKKKNQTDPLHNTYDITGLGQTEKRSNCFAPAISLRAGIVLDDGLYYFALGARRVCFDVKTETPSSIKARLLTPTVAAGVAKTIGGFIYLAEVRHSCKVGKKFRTTYNQITFATDERSRVDCATITSLNTRASFQETCLSITFVKKISPTS
jgi:hypothetical protein